MVGPEKVIEKIKDGVNSKKLSGITDVTDLTDRKHGLRLVIGIKTGFNPKAVLEQLYRHTPLEDSFNINNVALVDGGPQTLGLRELLQVYLDHRIRSSPGAAATASPGARSGCTSSRGCSSRSSTSTRSSRSSAPAMTPTGPNPAHGRCSTSASCRPSTSSSCGCAGSRSSPASSSRPSATSCGPRSPSWRRCSRDPARIRDLVASELDEVADGSARPGARC